MLFFKSNYICLYSTKLQLNGKKHLFCSAGDQILSIAKKKQF